VSHSDIIYVTRMWIEKIYVLLANSQRCLSTKISTPRTNNEHLVHGGNF